MSGKIRVLTIGHSYVVGLNRAIARELDPEPEGSPLRLVPLAARWSRLIHVFHYHDPALLRLVRGGHFDLVHAWEEPYIYAGYQITRSLAGSEARFCFRTAQSHSKRLPQPFRHFERATLARAQGWIAGGRLVYEAMQSRGYPADRGRVLTLAVDTSAFTSPDPARHASLRDRLGLRAPVIGYVGRLTSDKGLRVLMRAMDRVSGDRPWSLLLLGSGPMEGEVLRWADARGWGRRVRVELARHDQVPSFLAAMDLLVAPSQTTRHWKEQFGRMLIEAFACGVPVIGSDSGEIPHVVGDAGRIVPERDVAGWAAAIVELLERPELRADMATRGLERCRNYSVTTVAEQYRGYYRWLAGQPVP
jgi:glycosyltransferase involved in cell wall biosynthesis